MNNCLIICNGELKKRLIQKFLKSRSKLKIIATDGASDFLYRHKIIPDYIVGDLDSISQKTLSYFRKQKVVIKKIADQYKNDLEKAIRFALGKKLSKIFVIGFLGKRFDHTINNLSILTKYSSKNIFFVDEEFIIYFWSQGVTKTLELDYKKGSAFSLQGFPSHAKVSTSGLKYNLRNEKLVFGKKEGALNIALNEIITVSLTGGKLLVFQKHFGKISEMIS